MNASRFNFSAPKLEKYSSKLSSCLMPILMRTFLGGRLVNLQCLKNDQNLDDTDPLVNSNMPKSVKSRIMVRNGYIFSRASATSRSTF